MVLRLAVYCGSSSPNDPLFLEAARELGQNLSFRHLELVYGGSASGLMGAVADGALDQGGKVIGVLPNFMISRETAHPGVQDLRHVSSMHERKLLMFELSDAFVALPGGFGTLDELFEMITWRQIGLHQKPIGLLNVNGYFDSLVQFIDRAVAEGLINKIHRDFLIVDSNVSRLLDRLI